MLNLADILQNHLHHQHHSNSFVFVWHSHISCCHSGHFDIILFFCSDAYHHQYQHDHSLYFFAIIMYISVVISQSSSTLVCFLFLFQIIVPSSQLQYKYKYKYHHPPFFLLFQFTSLSSSSLPLCSAMIYTTFPEHKYKKFELWNMEPQYRWEYTDTPELQIQIHRDRQEIHKYKYKYTQVIHKYKYKYFVHICISICNCISCHSLLPK